MDAHGHIDRGRGGWAVLAVAGALVLVAALPAPARADVVAISRTSVSAGPALGGSAVVWAAPAGGRAFTVREAVPGAAVTTIYSAPVVPPNEVIAPLGLDGSATRVAVAYAVETQATGDADAPSPLYAVALGGPVAGHSFRSPTSRSRPTSISSRSRSA